MAKYGQTGRHDVPTVGRPRFFRSEHGFTGGEKALLICVALGLVLLVGNLVSGGSEKAASDARRALIEHGGPVASLQMSGPLMHAAEGTRANAQGNEPGPYQDNGAPTIAWTDKAGGLTGKLFINPPSPNDVEQGQMGDCYFLSSLAALAKTHPEILKQAITGPDKDGNYDVTFYKNNRGQILGVTTGGDTTVVAVDVKVPVDAQSGQMAYGHSPGDGKNNELWVALIEKAYAQYQGSYDTIGHGGWSQNAFSAVDGWPSTTFNPATTSPQDGINALLQAKQNNWPITADVLGGDPAQLDTLKLVNDHSYTVLDVKPDGSVMLRNPWGFHNPGTVNDTDPPTYISYADFMAYYRNVTINQIGQK
jgi:hypothetical protein